MTYSTNVPDATQSPALFPAQANTNFIRLQTIVSANHKFNNTAASDDGYHQDIEMLPLAGSMLPSNPAAGQLFANSELPDNALCYKDTADNLFQITPTMPIRAAASFFWTGAVITIRYAYNVSSIVRLSTGKFKLNFTNSLPNVDYIVSGSAMNIAPCYVVISPDPLYTTSVNTAFVIIEVLDAATATVEDTLGVTVACMGG